MPKKWYLNAPLERCFMPIGPWDVSWSCFSAPITFSQLEPCSIFGGKVFSHPSQWQRQAGPPSFHRILVNWIGSSHQCQVAFFQQRGTSAPETEHEAWNTQAAPHGVKRSHDHADNQSKQVKQSHDRAEDQSNEKVQIKQTHDHTGNQSNTDVQTSKRQPPKILDGHQDAGPSTSNLAPPSNCMPQGAGPSSRNSAPKSQGAGPSTSNSAPKAQAAGTRTSNSAPKSQGAGPSSENSAPPPPANSNIGSSIVGHENIQVTALKDVQTHSVPYKFRVRVRVMEFHPKCTVAMDFLRVFCPYCEFLSKVPDCLSADKNSWAESAQPDHIELTDLGSLPRYNCPRCGMGDKQESEDSRFLQYIYLLQV